MNTWEQIKSSLKQTLGEGTCRVWIEPLQARFEDGTLIVVAPNNFVEEQVKSRFLSQITQACETVCGRTFSIRIQADPAGKAAASQPVKVTVRQEERGLPIEHTVLSCPVNPQYRFENFVVGPTNEMAYVASQNFSRQHSSGMGQIFLSSAPGLGKSHLVQAIGNDLFHVSNKKRPRITYLNAEEFARQMVAALKGKRIDEFKSRYRENTDVLLLEDIHFFQGKEKMQAELLSTMQYLQQHGRKIVFTSCFLPAEIENLDPHLLSRFCQGFISVIERPDFETRMRILEKKACQVQVKLPLEVSELLAHNLRDDVRQLESCLNNLIVKARLLKEEICTDLALSVLKNYSIEVRPDIEKIVSSVCDIFSISMQDILSKSRSKLNVQARNTAFYLARKHTELSLAEIGKYFNRNHSTVIKGIANVERDMNLGTAEGVRLTQTIDRLQL